MVWELEARAMLTHCVAWLLPKHLDYTGNRHVHALLFVYGYGTTAAVITISSIQVSYSQ